MTGRFVAGDLVMVRGKGPLRVVDSSPITGRVCVAVPNAGWVWVDRSVVAPYEAAS